MHPFQDAGRPVDERAEDPLSRMTPEEKAALGVAFGRARPEGRLPFELAHSMAAVGAARPDVPNGTEAPVVPYGHGLTL
ncbi:hypothetical protein GCM10017562_51070 [Streptomyces roseofulvus]|uniref:hypothetical protein n=1 Tax=Streptomyces roseofulvus TaxID=33902 RepID=UPI0031FD8D0B